MFLDFKGIKIGDVSKSIWGEFNSPKVETSLLEKSICIQLSLLEIKFLYLPRMLHRSMESNSLLQLNSDLVKLNGCQPGLIPVSDQNIGWSWLGQGYFIGIMEQC